MSSPKDNSGEVLTYLNVGTGKDIEIKVVAKLISDLLGYKGEIVWDHSKPDGTPKKQLNISRLEKLGWKSKISLEEGLKQTINSYVKNKSY